ncbi:HlyD family efflux transporter periplasmic adaptor subunit [Eilatimonas milleporae]|uniref:HlyD family secretion protein n=1 Tax=Eilatimonas milleporae TaxID=911205 RepID=A0A3M0CH73_9PROT|nr:HlyD family efflux transporter periplasmic adaptor subunit [Eilatimonas milleporae]RMB08157.1 HlyD family secretion protein [Eilatimonas milleporae]
MMRPVLVAAMFLCLHGPQTAGTARAETATPPTTSPPTAIYALGRVEPVGEVITVAARAGTDGARIERLTVREGQRLSAGDVLAVLDIEAERLAQMAAAEADVALREATLDRIRLDATTDLDVNGAALEQMRAELATAHADHERFRQLLAKAAISEAEYDRKRRDFLTAEQGVRQAVADLARTEARLGEEQIDVAVAGRELDAARAELARQRARLENAYIRAPIDGVVLTLHARAGERIGSDGLLDMGDLDRMQVVAEVYQSDIIHVRDGQTARIESPVFDTALTGTVSRMGLRVGRQTIVDSDPAANTDARVVEVDVRLDAASTLRARVFTDLEVTVVFPR